MKNLNKTLVTNNLTLKVISLIMGFTFWFVWSDKQPTSCRVDVPLCVYNVPENAEFQAPETVKIQLSGKLKDLYDLDLDNLAVHIDGSTLHQGNNQCIVKNEQLLMPDDVKKQKAVNAYVKTGSFRFKDIGKKFLNLLGIETRTKEEIERDQKEMKRIAIEKGLIKE